MRNKLNLLQSRNKPNLRNRKNKQSLQSSRRNRRSSNRKRSHRSRSNRRRAKNNTSSNRSRLSRTKRRVSSTSKPTAKRKNHRESTHEMVRRIGTDTNITKVVLVLTIMPALRKTVVATTTDAENTLTAAIGSTQEHIRHGFTSRTCTSFWEQMGSGMQWHTMTLL